MKVLSIRQPWAALILADKPGWKNIENRSWYTAYRGWIRIHAAKTPSPRSDFDAAHEMARAAKLLIPIDGIRLRYGGIIGMARLVGVVRQHCSPWFVGPYGFVLEDPYPLPFEPCQGQKGLWDYGSLPNLTAR